LNFFIIFMGVSGSGKTTIGKRVADLLGVPFYEGDDFHSDENIQKMAKGNPLNDEDRKDWLEALTNLIRTELMQGRSGVLTCSALKEDYRKQLTVDPDSVIFIYLKGSYDLIYNRMKSRENHYMEPRMLKSQFDTLEEPGDIYTVEISKSPSAIVEDVMKYIEDITSGNHSKG